MTLVALCCGITELRSEQAKAMHGRKRRLKELTFDKKNMVLNYGNPKVNTA
jgi:hypothetical protein